MARWEFTRSEGDRSPEPLAQDSREDGLEFAAVFRVKPLAAAPIELEVPSGCAFGQPNLMRRRLAIQHADAAISKSQFDNAFRGVGLDLVGIEAIHAGEHITHAFGCAHRELLVIVGCGHDSP